MSCLIVACTGSVAILLGSRIIGALANAGFWAVALATANSLVAPNAKGRATAIVVGGVTIANVAGVPAGALIGETWGWRSAFLAVAVISLPAFIAILRAVPRGVSHSAVSIRKELHLLRNSRLLIALLLRALVNGGTFCAFTYLAPLFTTVSGFGAAWIPAILALFRIGSFLGVGIGGRIADRYPRPLLLTGMVLLLIGWTALALLAGNSGAALALVFALGIASFATGSTLISRVFYLATEAPTLAGGFATSAFNLGAAVGPWFGGMAISTELGFRAPPLFSALLATLALLIAVGYPRK